MFAICIRDIGKCFRAGEIRNTTNTIEEWPRLLAGEQQPDAPVGGMLAALYEAALLKFVEDTNQSDRLDLQKLGQTRLVDSLVFER